MGVEEKKQANKKNVGSMESNNFLYIKMWNMECRISKE